VLLFVKKMKALVTYIPVLASVSKHLPHFDLQWSKLGHYIFGALQQAFRDNVLSELEMDFLLLSLAGFVITAKDTISKYVAYAKSTVG